MSSYCPNCYCEKCKPKPDFKFVVDYWLSDYVQYGKEAESFQNEDEAFRFAVEKQTKGYDTQVYKVYPRKGGNQEDKNGI